MSLAWGTLSVVLFLLPGVVFVIGLYSHDRHSRELGKGGTVSDIGVATALAIFVHLSLVGAFELLIRVPSTVVGFENFSLAAFLMTIATAEREPTSALHLAGAAFYVLLSSGFGFGLGWLAGRYAVNETLILSKHRWPQEITRQQRTAGGYVFAFVLTELGGDQKRLVYRGAVDEFFVGPDGKISYLALYNCFKGQMSLTAWRTTGLRWTPILEGLDSGPSATAIWHRFIVEGHNIANVLFTRTPQIEVDRELEVEVRI